MRLTPTYYDVLETMRPFVIEAADADAAYLKEVGLGGTPVWSADDYPSRLGTCLEQLDYQMVMDAVNRTGMSEEAVREVMPSVLPAIRARMMSLYHSVNHEFHSAVNFSLFGKKTFHISDNLSAHLAHTEVNVKAGLIQLPFPCVLFVFTSAVAIQAMYRIHFGDSATASQLDGLDYTAPISVFATMHPPKAGLPGRHLVLSSWHAKSRTRCYLMLKRELYLDDRWTLEQVLRTDWEKLTPETTNHGLFVSQGASEVGTCEDDKFYTDGLLFYRIVMNAVLYLSSAECETQEVTSPRADMELLAASTISRPKRKQILKDSRQVSGLHFNEVGALVGSIVVDPLRDSPQVGHGVGGGLGPQVRFMVRGHWRQQPHGENGRERKLIWIRPHYKGPELGSLINRPYRVVRSG